MAEGCVRHFAVSFPVRGRTLKAVLFIISVDFV